MAKKNKSNKYNIDDEIIIGYNTSQKKTSSPKKNGKNKKKKKKNKWNKVKKVLVLLLKLIIIISIIVGIFIFLFVSPVFNVTDIKVENAEKVSTNTYIALSKIQIGENIFKVRSSNVKELIEEEPYVENVQVKRDYPGTIILSVTERKAEYLIEKEGIYIYIDKNGYSLETNSEKLELPILKGIKTDLNSLEMGNRLVENDLSKFNDLIKIIDAVKNNQLYEKLTYIDIQDSNNYILEFKDENKKIMLGNTVDLSTKVLWIKYFIEQKKDSKGTVHLNSEDVYFTPEG